MIELLEGEEEVPAIITELMGSLLKDEPIVTDPIAPIYNTFLGDMVSLEFNFANPLALESVAGESDDDL